MQCPNCLSTNPPRVASATILTAASQANPLVCPHCNKKHTYSAWLREEIGQGATSITMKVDTRKGTVHPHIVQIVVEIDRGEDGSAVNIKPVRVLDS